VCLGRTHVAMTGTLGLALAAPLSAHYLHHQMPVGTLFAFAGVTSGFGLLPDIDHPSSTLARTFGPATRLIAKTVGNVSGGHRKFTHTLWFAALMVLLVSLLANRYGGTADLIIASAGFYLTFMVLRLAPKRTSGPAELMYAIEAIAATVTYNHFVGDWWWLPWAVAFGVIGHIAGDILTTEGVPIIYPILPHFVVKLPILGSTDHWREHAFAFTLMPIAAYLSLAILTGNAWYGDITWLTSPDAWKIKT
jgi:membrane-bound metal-dependent hydrolase YbcI (DUF457 family)